MSTYSEKLSSISEYGEGNHSTRTSLTGLSMFSGSYSQSPSGGSLSTLSSVSSRNYKPNGSSKPGQTSNQIMTQRVVRGGTKHNYEFCKKVRVTMALLGILMLVAAIFMLSFYLPKQYQNVDDTTIKDKDPPLWDEMLFFDLKPDQVYFTFARNVTTALQDPMLIALKASLGTLISEDSRANIKINTTSNSTLRMEFYDNESGKTTLEIDKNEEFPQCFEVKWVSKYQNKLEDCFDTISSHWYGLGEVFTQKWPLDKAVFKMTPFLTSDFIDIYSSSIFGGILEPFVINSKGAGIYISDHVPLHISMNSGEKKMCLRADPTTEYNRMFKTVPSNATNLLQYTVCIEENIKKVHQLMFNRFIEKPTRTPDLEVMKKPLWSTWVRYKRSVNQTIIISMAEEIAKYKFERSHIQIEGQYSTNYGDFNFDPQKFPDVSYMMNLLKTLGFRVSIAVSPFTNLESKNFIKSVGTGIKVGKIEAPGISRWWNGFATILDTTNPKARESFINTLTQHFEKLHISGFKFDIGETNYLPEGYRFNKEVPNPNYYTHYYVEMASNYKFSEVRSGYKSQKYPTFVRMLDRTSYWSTDNGLQSVLTAALTFSILGYPYIVPDMVGGNGYYFKTNKELYVRWTQLSVFLPCIQFSVTPWDYDDEVVGIVRRALDIRKNLTHIMIDAAEKFPKTGDPIIRPLWWYWPTDHEAFVADTEFMLSDQYLIAPVMHLNIVSHAVYIPPGVWREEWGKRNTLRMENGGLLHYNVTLHDICYFKLLSDIPIV